MLFLGKTQSFSLSFCQKKQFVFFGENLEILKKLCVDNCDLIEILVVDLLSFQIFLSILRSYLLRFGY
jgi:hypothetical protein